MVLDAGVADRDTQLPRRPLECPVVHRVALQVYRELSRRALKDVPGTGRTLLSPAEGKFDQVIRPPQVSLGNDHEVAVAQPDFVRRAGPFAQQGTAQIQFRGDQPPVLGAAEDDDLPQVSPAVPASRQAIACMHGGRSFQRVPSRLPHFAQHIHVARRPLRSRGVTLMPSTICAYRSSISCLSSSSVRPWAGTDPMAGSWIVPSGVTRDCCVWPPAGPWRLSTAARSSSSRVFTCTGVTVMAGTL